MNISRENVESYGWGNGCLGWHLVRAAELSVIQEEMSPGTEEIRHRHARSRQFFYVLRGTLTMEYDGVRHSLPVGTGLEIAPGVSHQARNESAERVEFLVVSQPPSHGDRESVP